MIKVPLKKPIILITNFGDLYCTVDFAGKDTFKIYNVKKRVYTDDGSYMFVNIDEELGIIDREKVLGYFNINNTEKAQTRDNIISLKEFKKEK